MAWPETRDNLANMESWRRADVPVLPGSGPAPRLHDTATGELVLAAAGPVATLYACGITPYDATHMGHAATYTAWDLLVRAWLDARPETPEASETQGRYAVVYVQNVTDVDDPLLERADRDGEDWRELARRETQRYREDMEALRLLPPEPPDRRGRGAARHRAVHRPDGGPGRPVQRGRGRVLRQVGGPGVRLPFRARHRLRVRPGRDGRARCP